MLNVPVIKPLFIALLKGRKELGAKAEIVCEAGDFIFLSDSPNTAMRNIPRKNEYLAMLIEFEYDDFDGAVLRGQERARYSTGAISEELETCLTQFVELSSWAPEAIWSSRRKEILHLLCHLGYPEVLAMAANAKMSHRVHAIVSEKPAAELSSDVLCERLAMSESTLRRRLKEEGTGLQEIKDQVKLGLGLHLLQTTRYSIVSIAEECGYASQSRFTDRFKARFGLTPSELRKTKLTV